MNAKEIAEILLQHPDAKVKCFPSDFRSASNVDSFFTVREVLYNKETNTVLIYYFEL